MLLPPTPKGCGLRDEGVGETQESTYQGLPTMPKVLNWPSLISPALRVHVP